MFLNSESNVAERMIPKSSSDDILLEQASSGLRRSPYVGLLVQPQLSAPES